MDRPGLIRARGPAGARKHVEESLALRRELARRNPGSATAIRDVSVSLDMLGNVLVKAGELAGARKHFEESLALRRELSRRNPGSATATATATWP